MASMMATNRELNRRVQEAEAGVLREGLSRQLAAARREALTSRGSWGAVFQRMIHAFEEIKRIHREMLRASRNYEPDRWHSVSDLRGNGLPAPPGSVWATVRARGGEIASVRPADEIAALMDELLALRKRVGSRGRSAIAALSGSQAPSPRDGEGEPKAKATELKDTPHAD
jgi:hypothetical protein